MGNTQNRRYKRGEAHRDARLFIIVAEGEREDEYFRYFSKISRKLKIHIVPRDQGRSSPKEFLKRVNAYLTKEFDIVLESRGEDKAPDTYDYLCYVLDVDRWEREHIDELQQHCNDMGKWDIAISNPCFEIWLHNHMAAIPDSLSNCQEFKYAISRLNKAGYNVNDFAQRIEEATIRSKEDDKHPDHYYPDIRVTKVYLLAEQMLKFLGKNWMSR